MIKKICYIMAPIFIGSYALFFNSQIDVYYENKVKEISDSKNRKKNLTTGIIEENKNNQSKNLNLKQNSATFAKVSFKESETNILLDLESSIPPKNNMEFYHKIRGLIKEKSWFLFTLQQTLLELPSTDKRYSIIAQAMIAEGEAEGQRMIVNVLKQRFEEKSIQIKLIPMLALAPVPSEVTQIFLEEAAMGNGGVSSLAQLSLAIVAHRIPPSTRSEHWIENMLVSLRGAQSVSDKLHWLGVLGNTGSSSLLQDFKPFLDDAEPRVRGGGYMGLRWVKDNESLLKKGLLDEHPGVREKCVMAFQHSSAASQILKQHYIDEIHPRVRRVVLGQLYHIGNNSDMLRYAADYDSDEGVRREAAHFIELENQRAQSVEMDLNSI